jgi:hypothetical protein
MEGALPIILNSKIDVSLLRQQRLIVRKISHNAGHMNLALRDFYNFLKFGVFFGAPAMVSEMEYLSNSIEIRNR